MEFSFKDILRIIKKNIIFIVVISLVCAMGSFVVTKYVVKKTYTSSVKFHVNTVKGSTAHEDLNSYNYAEKLVATYIQMLDTSKFFNAVSDELNNEYSPEALKSMIKLTAVQDTEIFKADISNENPNEVKRIGDAVAVAAPSTIKYLLEESAELDIVDEAQVPKSPASPNVTKNVLLFFFAGLVISFIIAFVRDYFDIKIKYDQEMTTIINLPVLAAIPEFSFDDLPKSSKSKKSNRQKG